MLSEARVERLKTVVASRLEAVTVVMDAPHDPHNGAAIIRTCDALGIQRIHVIPRDEHFLASSVVTKGSEQWVDVVNHPSPEAAVELLRAQGYRLIGTHPKGNLTPPELADISNLALLLGNEHDGISESLAQRVDDNVRIDMRGFVESLNVSVSAAILLNRAAEGRNGDLAPAQKRRLYARWLLQSVSRSSEILDGLTPH
jgi:tRNA (guanosine-2'-O-)-methyltransferase